jgi:DNA gyrase subunit A
LIRTRVSEIREMGRVTQGVTLIDLDKGERLAGLERVVEKEEDGGIDEYAEDGAGEAGIAAAEVSPAGDSDGEGTE